MARRVLLTIVGLLLAAVGALVGRRGRSEPHPLGRSQAPLGDMPRPEGSVGSARTRLRVESATGSGRRIFVRPLAATAGALVAAWLGFRLVPPVLPDPTIPFDDRGAVEVYVSDPSVVADLDVVFFDSLEFDPTTIASDPMPLGYGLPPGREPYPRMVLWLRGERSEVVDWAVTFSGTARYKELQPFLDYVPPTSDPPPELGEHPGAAMRVARGLQILEGRAVVGPDVPESWRAMDWEGEMVGPMLFRSGTWPEYGSKSAVVVPAFRAGYAGSDPPGLEQSMGEPKALNLSVTIALSNVPALARVDAASAPYTTDDGQIWFDGANVYTGATIAYTNVPKETEESRQGLFASALLGVAATLGLSAAALWLEVARRRLVR
jgi:hypothetical protein